MNHATNYSACPFDVRTYPHDVFVAEGDPFHLVCGHQNSFHDHDHIWTRCKWTRPSDGLSCNFDQKKNTTSNRFEIYEDCPEGMSPKMRFHSSNKKAGFDGNSRCGMSLFGARLDNTGSWECKIDYTDWVDYGFGDEWCTATASAWLEVSILMRCFKILLEFN